MISRHCQRLRASPRRPQPSRPRRQPRELRPRPAAGRQQRPKRRAMQLAPDPGSVPPQVPPSASPLAWLPPHPVLMGHRATGGRRHSPRLQRLAIVAWRRPARSTRRRALPALPARSMRSAQSPLTGRRAARRSPKSSWQARLSSALPALRRQRLQAQRVRTAAPPPARTPGAAQGPPGARTPRNCLGRPQFQSG